MGAGGDARSSQKAMATDRAAEARMAPSLATRCNNRRVAVGVRANEHQAARGWLSPVSFTGSGGVEIATGRRWTV
jgi:hypothetical protein